MSKDHFPVSPEAEPPKQLTQQRLADAAISMTANAIEAVAGDDKLDELNDQLRISGMEVHVIDTPPSDERRGRTNLTRQQVLDKIALSKARPRAKRL